MAGCPPIELPSGIPSDPTKKIPLNFWLTGLQNIDLLNPPAGTIVLDQNPISIHAAVAAAWRVKTWQLTGSASLTYIGSATPPPPDVPDLALDSDAVTTLCYGGDITNPVTNPSELMIPLGQYSQAMNWAQPDDSWAFSCLIFPGFPPRDDLGYSGILLDSAGKLYLGIQFNGTGGIYEASSNGSPVSALGFDIMGIPMNLYGADDPDWDLSGAISLSPKEWWGWNGTYDTATGARL